MTEFETFRSDNQAMPKKKKFRRKKLASAKKRSFAFQSSHALGKILFYLVIFVCISSSPYWLFDALQKSPFFFIRAIEVQGLNQVSPQDIFGIFRQEQSFWTHGYFDLESRLRKIPWVRDAAIERSFPDKIRIKVDEYEPFARVELKQEHYFVNLEGLLFKAPLTEQFQNLPRISKSNPEEGFSPLVRQSPPLVRQSPAPAGGFAREELLLAIDLIQRVYKGQLTSIEMVDSVVLLSPEKFVLKTAPLEIHLRTTDLANQLQRLNKLLATLVIEPETSYKIDMNFNAFALVKPYPKERAQGK